MPLKDSPDTKEIEDPPPRQPLSVKPSRRSKLSSRTTHTVNQSTRGSLENTMHHPERTLTFSSWIRNDDLQLLLIVLLVHTISSTHFAVGAVRIPFIAKNTSRKTVWSGSRRSGRYLSRARPNNPLFIGCKTEDYSKRMKNIRLTYLVNLSAMSLHRQKNSIVQCCFPLCLLLRR